MADIFVGIDTSNYTTSAAVADLDGNILANLKSPLPVKDGAVGLRQSDAVFAHIKNLPELMGRLGEVIAAHRVLAVGVSASPRDAEDSYMPCFLSGVAAASAFAAGKGIPIYRFSHQNGHIKAALYSSGQSERLRDQRFGAFHVSGGTTEMLIAKPEGAGFSVELVGGSSDLHAGQAIDRIGVAMGLAFPCGPQIEAQADKNEMPVPRPQVSVKDGFCNLSGLENKALKLYEETKNAALTADFTLTFLARTLEKMALTLREKAIHTEAVDEIPQSSAQRAKEKAKDRSKEHARGQDLPIIFAGGVMSNRRIACYLSEKLGNVYFAEPAFSADNAAGIALLCRDKFLFSKTV